MIQKYKNIRVFGFSLRQTHIYSWADYVREQKIYRYIQMDSYLFYFYFSCRAICVKTTKTRQQRQRRTLACVTKMKKIVRFII